MTNITITYADGRVAAAEVDDGSALTVHGVIRDADGNWRAGQYDQRFPLKDAASVKLAREKAEA